MCSSYNSWSWFQEIIGKTFGMILKLLNTSTICNTSGQPKPRLPQSEQDEIDCFGLQG